MRARKAFRNTMWGLVYECVTLICGFIVPRLVLTSFGSQYNGITSAISQFLGVISLFQAGVSGVTVAALYKPLAEGDISQISIIIRTTERFLRRIALIFIVFAIIIAGFYPFLVSDEFEWAFAASLILVMSISTFSQYFFWQAYQLLLRADQQHRLIHIVNSIKTVVNTLLTVVLIRAGFGIHIVKLGASTVYVIGALFVYFYVKRKYNLVHNALTDNSVIKQRWDNFWQYVANFVTHNTDLVVLSFFSTVYSISVYTIYNIVVSSAINLFTSFSNGLNAAFGNMLANDEHVLILKRFRIYEQVVFALATFIFGVAFVMMVPFVKVYTKQVTDVNYVNYAFSYTMVCAALFRCLRVPYQGLVSAAGHFRQTRNPAFVEAAINISVSIALVIPFGIVGVAIGTLFAYVFRTVRYAVYMSRNIVSRSIWMFVKRLLLSAVCILMVFCAYSAIPFGEAVDYLTWAVQAIVISLITLTLIAIVELLFYRNDVVELVKMVKAAVKKKTVARST